MEAIQISMFSLATNTSKKSQMKLITFPMSETKAVVITNKDSDENVLSYLTSVKTKHLQ